MDREGNINASDDAVFKARVDVLLKELEISRKEMLDATSRNFDFSKFIFTTLIPVFGAGAVIYINNIEKVGLFIFYGCSLIMLLLTVYVLIAVSTYAFIAARASYELRHIRLPLCHLLSSKALLMWDIDPIAPLKNIWLTTQTIVGVIATISIALCQLAYAWFFIGLYINDQNLYVVLSFTAAYILIDFVSAFFFVKMSMNLTVFKEAEGSSGGLM